MSRMTIQLSNYLVQAPAPETPDSTMGSRSPKPAPPTSGSVAAPDVFVNPDDKTKTTIRNSFGRRFSGLAQDKDAFHAFFKKVYGNYNRQSAEQFRVRTLQGDTTWLPKITFASRDSLQGANGAYSAKKNTVFLASDLRSNPGLASRTFAEEVGHHLDTKVKTSDTVGDEGEMFRRTLYGESLSKAQISEIRNENDKGVIHVGGEAVEVEFFLKKIRKSFRRVTRRVRRTVSKVTQGVRNVAKQVVNRVSGGIRRVGGMVRRVTTGVGRVFRSVTQGVRGAVSRVTKGIRRGVRGVFSAVRNVTRGIGGRIRSLVGRVGRVFRQMASRIGRGVGGVVGLFRNAFHLVTKLAGTC